jgi:phosphonate transport system substrate-binding protein
MVRPSFIVAAALLLSLVGMSGCGRRDATEAPVLRIAFVPQQDQQERYAAAYKTLKSYLKATLGQRVEVTELADATTALEALRSHKLDLCNFSPWPFLIAEQKADVEALLVTMAPGGAPVSYHTVLVTHPGTGLRTMDDVKARAGDLIFSFEEAVSTSGHLVPRAYFNRMGLLPEKAFKQVIYSPDSTVSILAVKARRLDLAAVSYTGLQRNIRVGRVREDDIVTVWSSPPILANIVAVRRSLSPEMKVRVRDAFVRLPSASPEQWAEVVRQYSQPVAAYSPATDAILEPVRSLVRDVPGLELTL